MRARLFTLLVLGKLAVLAYLTLLWTTASNLSRAEYFVTLGVLVPMFAGHVALMVNRSTADRYVAAPGAAAAAPRLRPGFARMAYALAVAYPLLLWFILRMLGPGTIDFAEMNIGLGLVESTLGAWLGTVVTALTKK